MIFISSFAVLGSIFLLVGHAASPSVSREAEDGLISGQATVEYDPAASRESYVQFGNKASLAVRVVSNKLVDGSGKTIRLIGVNRPGWDVLTDTGDCTIGANGPPTGPIKAWGLNVVRIPMNENCWLGINEVSAGTSSQYKVSIHNFVNSLRQNGLYSILDLHRAAPGTIASTAMQPMPNADHSPAFWASVASDFINEPYVIFDLFNEPHLADVLPAGADYWACWRSGCTLNVVNTVQNGKQVQSSYTWQAAGMQQLVNSVRSTGARQPIMLEGLAFGNRLSASNTGPNSWLTYKPSDPQNQLIASPHVYNNGEDCADITCWTLNYLPVAQLYPIVTGEFGQNDCQHNFIDSYMQFADTNGISYLAWEWSPETSCTMGTSFGLITDWNGTPSATGVGFRNHTVTLTH